MSRTNRAWAQTAAVLASACAILGLVACESQPKWVKTGSYKPEEAKAFYSMGEVMGIRNEPLAWDAAENRARAQMVKILSTYTAYLMRDSGLKQCSTNCTSAPSRLKELSAQPSRSLIIWSALA